MATLFPWHGHIFQQFQNDVRHRFQRAEINSFVVTKLAMGPLAVIFRRCSAGISSLLFQCPTIRNVVCRRHVCFAIVVIDGPSLLNDLHSANLRTGATRVAEQQVEPVEQRVETAAAASSLELG